MLRRTLGLLAVTVVVWVGAAIAEEQFTADRHKKLELTCDACHAEAQPKAPALAGQCLVCHQSMSAVAERTKDLEPNPHENHVTEQSDLECTQCHHGHEADTPLCHRCHQGMSFEKKSPATR